MSFKALLPRTIGIMRKSLLPEKEKAPAHDRSYSLFLMRGEIVIYINYLKSIVNFKCVHIVFIF